MKYFWLLYIFALVVSCTQEEKKPVVVDWNNEKSTRLNKDLAFKEDMNIKMYLANRKSWKVTETGSGLRYYIYHHGEGELAQSEMLAEVKFKISMLDGTLCYATDSLETETFRIDRSEVESGIQEGIKFMHVGDKAKMIVPSHLGQGLVGDFDKIPPLTTLVVDLELVSLRKGKL